MADRANWEQKESLDEEYDFPAVPNHSNQAVDLLDSTPKSPMRRQIPPGLSEAAALEWQQKEDIRMAKEQKRLDAEKLKEDKKRHDEEIKKMKAQEAAEKAAAAKQAKQEKKEAARAGKEEKKAAKAEAAAAAKAEAARKAKERKEKWEKERDSSITGWQDFKYKAALLTQTTKHKVEILMLRRQVLGSVHTFLVVVFAPFKPFAKLEFHGSHHCAVSSETFDVLSLSFSQLVEKKRIMGTMLFDQLEEEDFAGAEDTFLQCKKSVALLQKTLKAKEAELARLEEDGEGETVAKPLPKAQLGAEENDA